MKNNSSKYVNYVLAFIIVATFGLIITNFMHPGFCPPYPWLGLPACVVMGTYFALMIIGHNVNPNGIGKTLFWTIGVIALISGIYFSYNEIMDLGSCPRAFGIPLPLCFTAPPTILTAMFFKWKSNN